MIRSGDGTLSTEQIETLEGAIVEDSRADRDAAAWKNVEKLLRAQGRQENVALVLIEIVEGGLLPIDQSLEVLRDVHAAYPQNPKVLGLLGEALEKARDIDLLNDSPPADPLFATVLETLEELSERTEERGILVQLLRGLFTTARMLARQHDGLAERTARRLVELEPQKSSHHYNLGLFLKTRGRFQEGMLANQAAVRLSKKSNEAYEWNLGICATGAGEGTVALDVWKRMKQKIEMGRFGLPEGRYAQVKVRLAERPLAERGADSDDPGLEETIWIERLSPCHGIVRSVLYQDLGIDFGDVVLIDGAPITYHKYGDQEIPVFPHLATLVKSRYRFFDFAGTQEEKGQLADVSADLERDSIVYAHSENYRVLCASCWRDPDNDHRKHSQEEHHVVTGRIAAPPDVDLLGLLASLDAAIAKRSPCRIFAPDLCKAVGLEDRARIERRRFEMLASS